LVLAEGSSARGVLVVHEAAVALDVAVLAADDDQHRFLVEGIVDRPRSRRLAVEEPARPELAALAFDLDDDSPGMDEVELVLLVVVVREALMPRWKHEAVDAERRDSERLPHLPETGALAELVERTECVCHPAIVQRTRPPPPWQESGAASIRRP